MTELKKNGSSTKKFLIYSILLSLVLLTGFVFTAWKYWQSSTDLETTKTEFAATQKSLDKAEIKGFLSTAMVEIQRGDSELALKDMSSFYTKLSEEINKEESAYSIDEREKLKSVVEQRDQIIAMLAKGDETSGTILSGIYAAYLSAIGQTRQSTKKADTPNQDAGNTNSSNQDLGNANVDSTNSANQNTANADVKDQNDAEGNVKSQDSNGSKTSNSNVKSQDSPESSKPSNSL